MSKEINVKAVIDNKLIPDFIKDKPRNFNKVRKVKLLNVSPQLIENFQQGKSDKRKPIMALRSDVIIPEYVGYTFKIPNGKDYVVRTVEIDMVGNKFGVFSETKKAVKHPQKTKVVDAKKKKGAK